MIEVNENTVAWAECKYGDLLEYIQPTKYIVDSTEYDDKYDIPVLTAGKSFIKGYTNERHGTFEDLPTIIFDDFTTASKYVNFPFKVKSSAMKILVPSCELVNLKFIYYCMQVNQIRSDTHKRYWISVYAKKLLFIPPLAEQKRIVSKIEELFSELDNGIESLKTASDQLKTYRLAVLKHAFEGKLTEQWREDNKDKLETTDELQERIKKEREEYYAQQFKDWKEAVKTWEQNGKEYKKPAKPRTPILQIEKHFFDLKQLPNLHNNWFWGTWEYIIANEDGSFKRGPFGSALKKAFFVKDGIKVYEQYCPINDDCSFERYFITKEKFEELKGFEVLDGDFLISCSGVTLGRITQVPKGSQQGIINQAILRVRLDKQVYSDEFFKQFFRSSFFQKRIFDNSTGSAIPNVKGVKHLKALPVPVLSLDEQKEIVSHLSKLTSQIDKMENDIATQLQKSEALRQSILKQAFSGKLVEQDPNDETASVLLERIKTEKETNKKPKKGKAV
jgi:type I restriction enzyme, S subunit